MVETRGEHGLRGSGSHQGGSITEVELLLVEQGSHVVAAVERGEDGAGSSHQHADVAGLEEETGD